MIRPSRVAVTPELTCSTWVLYCPLRVTSATPSLLRSPSMVRFLLMISWLLRLIVMSAPKATVSPDTAELRACRKLPTPLSPLLSTVTVARLY